MADPITVVYITVEVPVPVAELDIADDSIDAIAEAVQEFVHRRLSPVEKYETDCLAFQVERERGSVIGESALYIRGSETVNYLGDGRELRLRDVE